MGVNILEESKESMTCEKIRSPSSSTLSSGRIMGVPVRAWKTRSKSQSRLVVTPRCQWSHEGPGRWRNNQGQLVALSRVPLLQTFEAERVALQKLALMRLQEMNLGCTVEVPKLENAQPQSMKKKSMLLRKKAVTTNYFFDSRDKDKGSNLPVFGVPLSQCLAHDRLRMRTPSNDSAMRTGQKDHCEELLSLLRIFPVNTSSSIIHRDDNSSYNTRFLSPISRDDLDISRESLPDIHFGELQVPLVVQTCIRFLKSRGLNTLGIFRVSGAQKRVRQLREDFDSNKLRIVDDAAQPHDVAQLLKEYFRDLPEPLLTRTLYEAFLATQSIADHERKLKACRWLLYLLQVVHRDTLAILLAFLDKVGQNSEDVQRSDGSWIPGNKMNVHNLATVFGPNLLRSCKTPTDSSCPYSIHSAEKTQERADMILTVRLLIENYRDLFQVTFEDLDDVYLQFMMDDPDMLNAILSRRHDILKYQETSSSSSLESYESRRTSNREQYIQSTMQETPLYSQDFTDAAETSRFSDDRRRRTRPLMFAKEDTESSRTKQITSRDQSIDRRFSGSSDRNVFNQPVAVSAAFTIQVPTRGPPNILPISIVEPEQKSSSRTRRVAYGKTRHLTTPAYVTEETITNITIPPPRNSYRNMQSGNINTSSMRSKMDEFSSLGMMERLDRSRMRTIEVTRPIPSERWKRQELIASEHSILRRH